MIEPKLIYIAGPYRAPTRWEINRNICRAERVGLEVCKRGHYAVVPHKMFEHYDGVLSDEFFLAATMRVMERCDAMLVLPGWQHSVGTCREMDRARELCMPRVTMDNWSKLGADNVWTACRAMERLESMLDVAVKSNV